MAPLNDQITSATTGWQKTLNWYTNNIGNVGAGLSIVNGLFNLPKTYNANGDLSNSIKGTIESSLLSGKYGFWGQVGGAAYALADKTGLMSGASEGLGTKHDTTNFIASLIPGSSLFGKKVDKYDQSLTSKQYSNEYADFLGLADKAVKNSGLKLVSGAGLANNISHEAGRQDNTIQYIDYNNLINNDRLQIMTSLYGNRNNVNALGGYQQTYTRAGKEGLKFAKLIIFKHLKGSTIQFLLYLDPIIKTLETINDVLVDYPRSTSSNKKSIKELLLEKDPELDKIYNLDLFILDSNEEDLKALLAENQLNISKSYRKDFDADSFKSELDLLNSNAYTYNKDTNELIFNSKQLHDKYTKNSIIRNMFNSVYSNPKVKLNEESNIKLFDEIQAYKQGGTFNVIPEGALHKNKHHMEDADGLTKKGIPVVTEEGGELVLLAEIEKNEIIFRLEVTNKLEELLKKYSESKDDSLAIEAGKLLTDEIMHNTVDNTGLIKEC